MHIIRCLEVHDEMFKKRCLDLKHYLIIALLSTPNPFKNKVDFSYLANNKKSKKNNPHIINHRRICPRVVKTCTLI
jgi:hypothetical protein